MVENYLMKHIILSSNIVANKKTADLSKIRETSYEWLTSLLFKKSRRHRLLRLARYRNQMAR